MHIISLKMLREFCEKHPEAEQVLRDWHSVLEKSSAKEYNELKKTFNSADIVAGNKVIFDVGGNKYRIVGLVAFRTKRIFVLFVGTHAQYDAIDVAKL